MSERLRTSSRINRSLVSYKKKCFSLFLFLGSVCISASVFAKTDDELQRKIEALEARLAELEGRLESVASHGARDKGHDLDQ